MLDLAKAIELRSGIELFYCGEFHFALEPGHSVGSDRLEIAEILLDEKTQTHCLWLVDEVFALFASWTDELFRYAQSRQTQKILVKLFSVE
jgi:hypothetical protein